MVDATAPTARGDTVAPEPAQDVWNAAEVRRGRLRVRTLVTLRWMVLGSEVAGLAAMAFVLHYTAPYAAAVAMVLAGVAVNIATRLAYAPQRELQDGAAVGQLAFDILQMAALLALTGGSSNPFILLLLAPVTLAAATLPDRPLIILGLLAAAASMLLSIPTIPSAGLNPADRLAFEFRLTASVANVAGIALIAGYVRQSVEEAARMTLALDVTQTVLAREQRLSALGALAAAAAHELGTPLATIAIVAKEMSREAQTPSVKEDAELLMAQAERCREILRRLTATPAEARDAMHERLSLRQLVQEVMEPHADASPDVRVEAIVSGAAGVTAPDIRRRPEIIHAFTTLVENAVDFARSEILVSARFDADTVTLEVRDDGPGFAPEILTKLGEPYVTSRPGAEGSRTGHIGMGLGFFIAKTLLERTGAQVSFHNAKPRGAVVSARWSRPSLEVE